MGKIKLKLTTTCSRCGEAIEIKKFTSLRNIVWNKLETCSKCKQEENEKG